tara:strand:+ start:530 stop:991 length:462 start_codon:yes stop_codon:yes gene_type:complete
MFSSLEAQSLKIGSEIPAITALDHNGSTINLKDQLSKGLSLIFFYPKADTPGCTQQACSVRDAFSILQIKGVQVFGISSDTPKSQNSFKKKYALPYCLISDRKAEIAKAFGKSRWSRQAYLFNNGLLIWKDTKGATSKQGEEAISALRELNLF